MVRVYDIVNAGPRHRFTVSGRLVHNCLALGYASGVAGMRGMGATGSDEELQQIVKVWRRANPKIVRLWDKMAEGFSGGGPAGEKLRFTRHRPRTIRMHLPCGRQLRYHQVRWEHYVVKDQITDKTIKKVGWRYASTTNPKLRIGTYGGKLTENASQAIMRDIHAAALVRLEEHGYPVVGHVHDEVIIEGEHDVDKIIKIMCEPLDWTEGLPIAAEGFITQRYSKG
jgi:DNA polymerase